MHARSDGLNCGSKFVVRLPALPKGTEPERSAAEDRREGVDVVAQRILVVDDNDDAAESSAVLLRLSGHEVQVAAEGQAALDLMDTFRPDVVLLDIGLPDMDGYEVARRIRSMPGHAHVLLVALSGYGQAEHLVRSREAGFNHHLVKPADLRELDTLIASWHNSPDFGGRK